jgi:hypothetical protein
MKAWLLRFFFLLCVLSVRTALGAVHYVDANGTNSISPYTDWSTAATNIQQAVDVADPGDQILVTNGVYKTGGRPGNGLLTNRVAVTKPVTIQSVNGPLVTVIKGIQDPFSLNAHSAVRCVYLTNGAMLAGFTLSGGGTRLGGSTTTNDYMGGGVYCESTNAFLASCILSSNSDPCSVFVFGGGAAYSGTLNNCVISNNTANGYGGGAYESALSNCLIVGNIGSSGGGVALCQLDYCTLSANQTLTGSGAGALGGILNNCVIIGNSNAYSGGGASGAALNNCLIATNVAGSKGGGLDGGSARNCLIIGNSSSTGGGVSSGNLTNSIVYYNSAPGGYPPNCFSCTLTYCCTTPLATGRGNISNDPKFVNRAAGDFHLQTNSPCINAGWNPCAPGTTDLDGNPRIVGGTVDIGAYEFQSPTSLLAYAWLQQYGFPTDGSADFTDPDNDGMNNWQEWIAGTDPTDPLSVLSMVSATKSPTSATVTWESTSTRSYFIQRASELGAQPAFATIVTNVTGRSGTTTFTDTNAAGGGPWLYRVGVQQ